MRDNRQQAIISLLSNSSGQTVKYLSEKLNVSEMTIRRDLAEMEKDELIIRLHGGAKLAPIDAKQELSHETKMMMNMDLKEVIAKKIADNISNGELIFLGAGTTIELVCKYLEHKSLKIVTNSLPVFLHFKSSSNSEVILIGGNYRTRTDSFVGAIADNAIKNLRVTKAFIGVNAINNDSITNYNQEEGTTQSLVLQNAQVKYIVADHTKLDKVDFYHFFNLNEADYLIVDDNINVDLVDKYSKYIKIL